MKSILLALVIGIGLTFIGGFVPISRYKGPTADCVSLGGENYTYDPLDGSIREHGIPLPYAVTENCRYYSDRVNMGVNYTYLVINVATFSSLAYLVIRKRLEAITKK